MGKDLEGKTCEERLRALGLLGTEPSRLREALMVTHSSAQGGAALSSALTTSGPREWRGCIRWKFRNTRLFQLWISYDSLYMRCTALPGSVVALSQRSEHHYSPVRGHL